MAGRLELFMKFSLNPPFGTHSSLRSLGLKAQTGDPPRIFMTRDFCWIRAERLPDDSQFCRGVWHFIRKPWGGVWVEYSTAGKVMRVVFWE